MVVNVYGLIEGLTLNTFPLGGMQKCIWLPNNTNPVCHTQLLNKGNVFANSLTER